MQLTDKIEDKGLRQIAEKVLSDVPVDREDAKYMLKTTNILELGEIANHIRTRLHEKNTYYGVNLNLNYTNICELRCPLCAYSCDKGDENAFILTVEEVEKRLTEARAEGVDEVHIVGGLHPDLKLDYFETLLQTIKRIIPDIHIVAFTAVEYDYFAKLNDLSLTEVFNRLKKVGLNAIPGGGAEIFAERVRDKIAPKKISGKKWLNVMKTAHGLGIKTNATMLYNHIEDTDDIIDHLFQLRDLQDETGGFKTFVPLQFHEKNTEIKAKEITTGFDDIRIYASSRIILHNIPHIKALWMYVGEKMAQILQKFGVDDIGATYRNEKVVHAAGAETPDVGSEAFLIRLIEDAGLQPVRAAADYNPRKPQ